MIVNQSLTTTLPNASRGARVSRIGSTKLASVIFGLLGSLGCGARSGLTEGTVNFSEGGSYSTNIGGTGGTGGTAKAPGSGGTVQPAPRAPEQVLAISAGSQHSCALIGDHTVRCWGINNVGQLGDGTRINRSTPVAVMETAVYLDYELTNATVIAATHVFSCALIEGGSVMCWGYNDMGQLGNGTTESQSMPTLVKGISTATSIGIGSQHGCAVVDGGNVRCWGYNQHGQLGDGTTVTQLIPTQVVSVTQARLVATAGEQSCALLGTGQVQCWGFNGNGELGNGTTIDGPPATVIGITGATSLALGDSHGCALIEGGSVRCWGRNDQGQLATGTTTDARVAETVLGLEPVWFLAAGFGSTAAVLMNGNVMLWGSALDYVMTSNGPGEDTVLTSPSAIAGISDAYAVSVGSDHACALMSNSRVACWGHNSSGQLGDGTRTDSILTPVYVVGLQ